MTKRSRVPNIDIDPEHYKFLDGVDRRQQALADVENLGGAATLTDVINKLNEMLATHRTR